MAPNLILSGPLHYVAITGHRPHKFNHDYAMTSSWVKRIENRVVQTLLKLKMEHTRVKPITGLAVGIDQMFALISIELGLPFIAAVPCKDQERMWPIKSQKKYRMLLNHPLCSPILITDGPYNNQCMQTRNEWMVDNCNTLIAVFDGTEGGTANCVNYAKSIQKPIIYINPNDCK